MDEIWLERELGRDLGWGRRGSRKGCRAENSRGGGGNGEGGRIVRAEWCWEQDDGREGRLIGPWRGWVGSTAIRKRRRRRRREACAMTHMITARGGVGFGGGTLECGGGWSPSLIFIKQPLERENTPFFLQMTARVCGGGGGVPSPLIEPIMGREGKGPT